MIAGEGHVVMVDDSDTEIVLARECFRRSVLTNPWKAFTSANEFLAYLGAVREGREPMPPVVLLDINMPQKNGFDVLQETRADPHFSSLPVFWMLTNSDNPRDRDRAVALGARGLQVKPDNVDDYVSFFNSLA